MNLANRKEKKIVNLRLQYKFLGFTLLMSLISIMVIYMGSLYIFWNFEQTGYSVGLPEGHIFFKFIGEKRLFMNCILLIFIPILTLIIGFTGIRFLRRIIDPIYKITKHLEELNETGEIKEIKLHNNDYFIDLENEFNKYIKKSIKQ